MGQSIADRLALVNERDAGDGGKSGEAFVSRDPADAEHVFGGLLIGQALRAASLTVAGDRPAHSLHASFVVAGHGGEPLRYEVERTRDGASFATRRVVARQQRGVVLVLTAGFHADEPGPEYEAAATAVVPGPDGLPAGRYDSPWFESRDVPVEDGPASPAHARRAWFRATEPLGDD